jgi:hypothetical protein
VSNLDDELAYLRKLRDSALTQSREYMEEYHRLLDEIARLEEDS